MSQKKQVVMVYPHLLSFRLTKRRAAAMATKAGRAPNITR